MVGFECGRVEVRHPHFPTSKPPHRFADSEKIHATRFRERSRGQYIHNLNSPFFPVRALPRMRTLRSTWRMRLLVAVLAASLLPVAFALPGGSAQPAEPSAQADWLRAQLAAQPLEEAAQADVDRALQAAAQAPEARTLDGFLAAFVEAHAAPERLAEALGLSSGLSASALVQHLQQRFLRLAGLAAPRISLAAAVPSGPTLTRLSLTAARAVAVPDHFFRSARSSRMAPQPVRIVSSLRTLFAAQPLGP